MIGGRMDDSIDGEESIDIDIHRVVEIHIRNDREVVFFSVINI